MNDKIWQHDSHIIYESKKLLTKWGVTGKAAHNSNTVTEQNIQNLLYQNIVIKKKTTECRHISHVVDVHHRSYTHHVIYKTYFLISSTWSVRFSHSSLNPLNSSLKLSFYNTENLKYIIP